MSSAEEEFVSGEEEEEPVCRLSLPAEPHTLSRRDDIKTAICFAGSGSEEMTFEYTFYYYCTTCDVEYCKVHYAARYLRCTLSEFSICYVCAIIPDKLHYKYDALRLSLCYGEVSDETYWCEVCETKLDPREWFYKCNKPYITIHCKCAFGYSAYMKPGYTFDDKSLSLTVKVICNGSSTRPFCNECKARCSSSVYFKFSDETVACSMRCYRWKRL